MASFLAAAVVAAAVFRHDAISFNHSSITKVGGSLMIEKLLAAVPELKVYTRISPC